ncbi:variable surface protein Vir18-like [Plasmodium vivax]|uniref:Variable surface protein Vir18-like n=1 Tax=Plasmodium vivax (strain Salvador I) TaxID=126793 RepID=A5KD51_PLAVS|nr:variable surface protein Vir18-like [Plasmodium vivax]EDL42718.1 variable surface protein Vir18-like [Plasmodium vivax]|eukprot:XP_001612511.1 variable surface protein Vir18-like [Plasmodium vivax Sal-1]
MTTPRSRLFSSNNYYAQRFIYPGCLTKYSNIKNDIIQQINALSRKRSRNYYNDHSKIKNYIVNKNEELNSCYGDNLLRTKLIEDYEITSFLKKCPSQSNCPDNRGSQVKKAVVPKHATEDPCKKGGKSCNNEAPGKKVEPGQRQGQRDAVVSITENLKVQDSVDPDRNHAEADGLKQEVATHAQPEIKPFSEPVVRDSEASKPKDNQNSSPPGHVEPPKDPISDSIHSPSTELEGQLISSSTQRIPEQEPVSIDNSQEMTIGKNPDEKSPHSANTSDEQDNSDNPLGSKDSNDDDTTTETLDIPVLSSTISGDSNSINQVTNDVNSYDVCASGRCPNSADGGDKRAVDAPVSGQTTGLDVTLIEDGDNQVHDSSTTCIGSSCREIRNDELIAHNSDKSDIFNQIFSTIQANKGNVIKTSIPMGIVLFLSLLFKYTPLWRILTKRKRKKQSHMNEKLQRVLQQPSIASEERSIPFSYSAFEYSS